MSFLKAEGSSGIKMAVVFSLSIAFYQILKPVKVAFQFITHAPETK
jgi:hypothetical protein